MRLVDYEALKQRGFRYSRTHLWRLVKAGQFPKPVKLGGGARNAWIESEIDEFISAMMAERDGPAS
jgi:prophage regulatory protein